MAAKRRLSPSPTAGGSRGWRRNSRPPFSPATESSRPGTRSPRPNRRPCGSETSRSASIRSRRHEDRHDHRRDDDALHELYWRDDDAPSVGSSQRGHQHLRRRDPVPEPDDGAGRRGDRRRLRHGLADQLRCNRLCAEKIHFHHGGRGGFAEDAMAPQRLKRLRVLCASTASSAVKRFPFSGEGLMRFYWPIAKLDHEQRMVWGYASTEAEDEQGEIVSRDALAAALADYMRFANIREMHQPSAVGIAEEAAIDDRGLYLGARKARPVITLRSAGPRPVTKAR